MTELQISIIETQIQVTDLRGGQVERSLNTIAKFFQFMHSRKLNTIRACMPHIAKSNKKNLASLLPRLIWPGQKSSNATVTRKGLTLRLVF